ncbi:MAG: Holliday junction resolvase RuvX [Candidatus Latescibacterota bacterium]
MRILSVDPGDRRVGLAVSDPLRITAQGLDTFDKRTGEDLVHHVLELVLRYDVQVIVVGHPISMSGRPSESSKKAERLAAELRKASAIEVVLWDERLSSEEAKRVLKGSRAGKEAVDKISAMIILQNYLDFRSGEEETNRS